MSQDDTFLDAETARANRLALLVSTYASALRKGGVSADAIPALLERYADALLTEQYYRAKEFARDTL